MHQPDNQHNNQYGAPPEHNGYPNPHYSEKPGIPNNPAFAPVAVEQYPPRTTPPDKQLSRSKCGFVTAGVLLLASYSTIMSGLWLMTAIVQPRWGDKISAKSGYLSPSNAALVSALVSKTIEISFATVFVGFVGQVFSRRAMAWKGKGVTLAEMTMKYWVIQPGSIFTHIGAVSLAGFTFLGVMSFGVLIATLLYTTASEALVSPKLKYSPWRNQDLTATVHTWYGNPVYAARKCHALLKENPDPNADIWNDQVGYYEFFNCLILQFSSQSSHDLYSYLLAWNNTDTTGIELVDRPAGGTMLENNVTLEATWTEPEYKDVPKLYKQWGRIVDNATISLPHPRVWEAFRSPSNGILQPEDLGGLGGVEIKASVSSPTLNVLCANVDKDEIGPVVYEAWPQSQDKNISQWLEEGGQRENTTTVVDDIFGWGDGKRSRPLFEEYPKDYVFMFPEADGETDPTVQYVLTKAPSFGNYTLCQLRSWLSADCSTRLNIGGTPQPALEAHCGSGKDLRTYQQSLGSEEKPAEIEETVGWAITGSVLAQVLSLFNVDYLGLSSNPSILTRLILKKPELPTDAPSMAEAFCVFALTSLSSSAMGTSFRNTWDYGDYDPRENKDTFRDYNKVETFQASVSSQQYTSGHVDDWQKAFYAVLGFVFVTNLMCLFYFLFKLRLVEDFTDPGNHFALAINSPPTEKMAGSCVNGPQRKHLGVRWRIASVANSSGYCFETVPSESDGAAQGGSGVYQRVPPQA